MLVCRPLEEAGFVNGFSTRLGGVSDFPQGSLNLAGFGEDSRENIEENRRRFLDVLGADTYRLATVWQVHGDVTKAVRSASDITEATEKADALASDLEQTLIGVKTADCVPVLIGDRSSRAFGAIHAGWRGTAQSIVTKTVEKMRSEFGTEPRDLIAAIGPAAGCRRYEVGSDVIDMFGDNFENGDKYFTPTREGHALVDLHQANRDQLVAAGVPDANIFTAPLCTMERNDLFFSYRLEKTTLGRTGRLLSVIGRR